MTEHNCPLPPVLSNINISVHAGATEAGTAPGLHDQAGDHPGAEQQGHAGVPRPQGGELGAEPPDQQYRHRGPAGQPAQQSGDWQSAYLDHQEVRLAVFQPRQDLGEKHQPQLRHRGGAEDVHHRLRAGASTSNQR